MLLSEHGIFPGTTRPEGAWLNALIATPTILGRETGFATVSISILPNEIKLEPAERRTLRVVALGYDGPVKKERDITSEVRWKIPNQSLAYINKDGVLFAKHLGRTEFECEYSNFVAKATVDVANIPSGSSTFFFKGRRRLAQVRLDTDENLYFCNQSQQVFSISKDGGLSIVLSLEVKPFCPYVISCLAIDDQKRLYVNDMTRSTCHRFEWDGSKFVNAKQLGGSFGGQKNSIAIIAKVKFLSDGRALRAKAAQLFVLTLTEPKLPFRLEGYLCTWRWMTKAECMFLTAQLLLSMSIVLMVISSKKLFTGIKGFREI